jgi:RHS repeat-associated protein
LKINGLTNPKHSLHKTTSRNLNMLNITFKQRVSYRNRRKKFTGKELDAETGLYYYGARYLAPKTSRWLSGDPAMGEYLPVAPVSDEARKHNGNLPGQGGVFNYVNLHAYHYAGNNPVKYTDPDGRKSGLVTDVRANLGAGHSGIWVERYDENGNLNGFIFLKIFLINKNANYLKGDGKPAANWMANLVGFIAGGIPGAAIANIINEVAIRAGVNGYQFKTKDEMLKFIAQKWYNNTDKETIAKIRQTVFNTSVAQDEAIMAAAVSEGKSFGRYDLLSNNCVQFAARVLSAGGVNTSSITIPNKSHDYIDKNNQALIDRNNQALNEK